MLLYLNQLVSISLKFFFLLTPFFVLSAFLSLTMGLHERQRRRLAIRVCLAIVVTAFCLFFFGNLIFSLFGITLDSFRIGGGALLFLSAVRLARSEGPSQIPDDDSDIAVVPLAIPIAVGPATTGALLIMGAETQGFSQKILGFIGLLGAAFAVGVLLVLATRVERWIGRKGISILSKLTGLIVAAIAAQLVFTGIRNML